MLAPGLDHGKRGGRGPEGPDAGGPEQRAEAPSRRPLPLDPCAGIKQKISQWEGRSLGDPRSRNVLANGVWNEDQRPGAFNKRNVAKAKSLGLDFRESPGKCGPPGAGKPSDSQRKDTRSNKMPSVDLLAQSRLVAQEPDSSAAVKCFANNASPAVPIQASDDAPGESLPPGNFYTSRGFWRRLEGDDGQWGKGREAPSEPRSICSPPPKPQRTFQYRGTVSPPPPWDRWDYKTPAVSKSRATSTGDVPPSCQPHSQPATQGNGFSRHRKNRKSFEYEDAARLAAQQAAVESDGRPAGLYHAFSDHNIYEDIIVDLSRENPYKDTKSSPMCLPLRRPRPSTISQRPRPRTPKLPPKPVTVGVHAGKSGWGGPELKVSPPHPSRPGLPRNAAGNRTRARLNEQYVERIQAAFDAKRGKKRVRCQLGGTREETSGTDSDTEEGSKGCSKPVIRVHSTLKRNPRYRTLEKDLIQLQEHQLFQIFVVVSLRKKSPGNTYSPEITQQFPNKFEKASRHCGKTEDRLKAIPKFCFPDSQHWCPSSDLSSETFSFVLTGEDGSRWFCYCRKILPGGKGQRLPEVHCIVSRLGCFNLFTKILEEVERRREISPALVYPFMRSVMDAPFPAPGRTIAVKSFLPGAGNEVLTLQRPVDSRLEHVDFENLLQCLSVERLLQVFASLLLERRVIFIADKLGTLSRCAHAALALLYPFTWQHTFVPVLPASMLDISCSPTPFLMGALSPSLPELLELPIEEVLIVDLCADRFVIQLGDEDAILPRKLQSALLQILTQRDEILSQEEVEARDLSGLVSEAFVRFFVELVGHYSLHMGESSASGGRQLDRDAFRKSHPSRGARQFLQLFMETQMFAGFIQDRELRKGGVKGLFEVRSAEYLESDFEPEPSGVNRFLKGLGNKMKFLQKK